VALGAGDCERLHHGLIAQPVNTASALAYVAVGAWLAGRGLRGGAAGRPGPDRRRVAFGLAVAAAGVGSVDFHGPGSPAARLLHDGGLYAVLGFVAWHEVARRVGPWRRRAGAPQARDRRVASRDAWPVGRRRTYRLALAAAAAGAACWWAGRSASPWCDPDRLLQPHAAWHLLGAFALAAWGRAVYAEAASSPSPRRR
jgi:hypothetical protein